ncbi:hypothetical protein [Rhodobium orientis]|uniref:hypothetical protein n=1 Tax=Rhodobium orientis TaxID=34017 RepID=UPI001472BCEC|nr:hypothetical protein [Rhodobium orientis]
MIKPFHARLSRLEDSQAGADAAVKRLTEDGLRRIDQLILPTLANVQALASNIGAMLTAPSRSELTVGIGAKTVIVTEPERYAFAPTGWVVIRAIADPSAVMVASVDLYLRDSGQMQITAVSAAGAGTFDAWTISPSPPPILNHEARADNPHRVTADQVGAYAKAAVDAALEARLNVAAADALYPRLDGVNAGPLSGFANLIVNGGFGINQRDFAGGMLAAGEYGNDRFRAGADGAEFDVADGIVTLAGGSLIQTIEDPGLAGKTVTVDVDDPSADLGIDIGGATGVIAAGAGRRGVQIAVPSGLTDLDVEIAGTGASFSRLQLREGGAITAFETRPPAVEEMLCHRYFAAGVSFSHSAMADGAGQTAPFYAIPRAPVPMRVKPAVVAHNVYNSSNVSPGSFVVLASFRDGAMITVASSGAGRTFWFGTVDYDAEF